MSDVTDHFKPDRVRRPFQGMGGPVKRLDGFGIAGVLSEAIGQHIERLHIFIGFRRKIGQDFRIDAGHQIL